MKYSKGFIGIWKSSTPVALTAGLFLAGAVLYHGDGWRAAVGTGIFFALFLLLLVTIGGLLGVGLVSIIRLFLGRS
jgi:hypothetical protein